MKRWHVTVRVETTAAPSERYGNGWNQRTETFRFRFQARDRAEALGDDTLLRLYGFVTRRPAGWHLTSQQLPNDRRLKRAIICWGSTGARGKQHGWVEVVA